MAARKNPSNSIRPNARPNSDLTLDELLSGTALPPDQTEGVSPEESAHLSSEGDTSQPNPQPQDDQYVNLGKLADEDPSHLTGVFSDDPPPGFMVGHRGVDQPSLQATREEKPRINAAKADASMFPKAGHFAPGVDRAPEHQPTGGYDQSDVARARASLMADAENARHHTAEPDKTPTDPLPAHRRPGSSHHDVRQALAKASMHATQHFRSRITVGAAYQYDGNLHLAPDFVDRNWIGYDNGPAIIVPDVGVVRAGEWLVVQNILDDDGSTSHSEIKVYRDHEFKSLFMVEEENADTGKGK